MCELLCRNLQGYDVSTSLPVLYQEFIAWFAENDRFRGRTQTTFHKKRVKNLAFPKKKLT